MRYLAIAPLVIALAATMLPHPGLAATPCTDLTPKSAGRFEAEAPIPPFTPLCYAFTIQTGQQAAIRVTTADRMAFGLETVQPGGATKLLVDRRQTYLLTAEAPTYHVLVASEDLHPDTTHRFTLVIEVK